MDHPEIEVKFKGLLPDFTIKLPEELWALVDQIGQALEVLKPFVGELTKTFETLREAAAKWDPKETTAALQNLNQMLGTTKDLFAAIEQIDEQRLITLVAALEKLADELNRLPTDIALPRRREDEGAIDPSAPSPIPLPAPRKPAPPVSLPAPARPDRLRGLDPSIDWGRLPRTGFLSELSGGDNARLFGGLGADDVMVKPIEISAELQEIVRRLDKIIAEFEKSAGGISPALEQWRSTSATIEETLAPYRVRTEETLAPLRAALDMSPTVHSARDALDDLHFDWQHTLERMSGELIHFAETGKFEWRGIAKIALESIEDMLLGWAELEAQRAGQGGGKKGGWLQLAELAYTAAASYFGTSSGSGSAAYGSTAHLESLPAGFRAAGGPVSPFTPYMVGERGPELFVPRMPGEIVPNHALARGGSGSAPVVIHQHLTVMPGVPEAVRREVSAMMPQIANAARGAVMTDLDRNSGIRRRIN